MVWCDDRETLCSFRLLRFAALTLSDAASRVWKDDVAQGPPSGGFQSPFQVRVPKYNKNLKHLWKKARTRLFGCFSLPASTVHSSLSIDQHRPIEIQLPLEAKIVVWSYTFFSLLFHFSSEVLNLELYIPNIASKKSSCAHNWTIYLLCAVNKNEQQFACRY